jgi:ParB-like chromosome segregation protein Spo0J
VKLPPILARKQKNGLYLVLDGNHRVAAHQAEEAPIDVYECEGRDETLTLIMYEANTLHGLPTSEEDRINGALFLVDQGFGMKEAADKMLVSVTLVRKEVGRIEADRRAARVQIDPRKWGKLPESIRLKLVQLRTDESFEAATLLVCDARMKSDAVIRMVTELNKETSLNTQLAMIAAAREELTENIADAIVDGGTGRRGSRSPKARLGMAAGQLKSLGDPGAVAASIPVPEREGLREKVTETRMWLTELEEALVV